MKPGRHAMGPLMGVLLVLLMGCRSPLLDLRPPAEGPFALALSVRVEDHSRNLRLLRDVAPGEPNTPLARREALEAHRAALEAGLRQRLAQGGLAEDPAAPQRLELTLSTVGEVRTKYIVYGILSGVAWGVGTGLLTHNPRLALGLGAYELLEESVFWIAGSSLFGRFSAPVVLEARILEAGRPKPLWEETYYVIGGGERLKAYPEAQRDRRSVQLAASLDLALDRLFKDLRGIPGAGPAPPK